MFSELSTGVIVFLVGSVSAILLYLLILYLRNPVLAKLGLRNIARRPTQTALIVIGLTLSTIIVISSLGTGDTLRYSVQHQAVAAYGKVDEIIAPPLVSMLMSMGDTNADNAQAQQAQATLDGVMKGGLDSVLALAQGGLPSIDVNRLEQLRLEAAKEPLIDGVAGAIVFPTIIRNIATGQSEPIGFIYAVDDTYPAAFGLKAVTGQPLAMQSLEPGIGNIFLQASKLFAVVPELTRQFNSLSAQLPADAQLSVPSLAPVLAGLGAILTGVDPAALPDITVDLDTLDQLGVNTGPLRALGKTSITLRELATIVRPVASTATLTGTLPAGAAGVTAGAPITETALLSATAALLSSASISGTSTSINPAAALGGISSDLLRAVNLNTIGFELDKALAQFGLQLRQGDLYLNRLGAQQLNASVGDVLEIYIGPLPVRFRVRAVVDEAGPLSALLPVVILRLSEAQQLLFMNDKVNAVLISNAGDEMTGMQHTDAVGRRLRVLALDTVAVDTIATIVRRADVRTLIEKASQSLPATASIAMTEEDVPPLLRGVLEGFLNSLNIEQMSQQDVAALLAAVQAEDKDALREVLARQSVREWLLELKLPESVAQAFASAVTNLNQFEQIDPLNKSTIVTAANIGGGVFSSIFSIFGVFSILAAILLIILIFVMLAAERRVEIGVARAIGVQRGQIMQMFMTEGMVYNLLAGALGVILGIAITMAMTAFIGRLFNDATGQFNAQAGGIFAVAFTISWQSVVVSYCLGVLITWLAMTFATTRVSRMNIVMAIRNLPDEAQSKRRSLLAQAWSWLFPLAVTGLGAYLLWLAFDSHSLSLAMIGATVALYGVMTVLGRLLELTPMRNETGYTIVYSLLGLGLLAIWVPPWYALAPQLAPGFFTWDPTQAPTVFTIGGPMIIVGVILLIMFNAGFLSTIVASALGFVPSLRPVLKTAIAYPLSTRFRTGMTMVLFAMIMATVVVMAVIINTTQSLIRLDPRQTAGFDIRISPTLLSFFSPVEDFTAALAKTDATLRDQVERVGLVTNQAVEARVRGAGTAFAASELAGVNAGYLQQAAHIYQFQARAPGYADDAAVWDALQQRDDVVVIKPGLLALASGAKGSTRVDRGTFFARMGADEDSADDPPNDRRRRFAPTLEIEGVDVRTGQLPELFLELTTAGQDGVTRTHIVQVIGVLGEDTTLAAGAIQGSEATLRPLRSVPVTGDEVYVKVNPGAAASTVAAGIEGAFVASGLNASVLADEYAQRQRLTGGALQLLQGFMALGLLVGIAALGVISMRAVIERRQQIGMLRAMGYQKGMVTFSFVVESSFVSITGLLIGALTGIVLGDNLVFAFFPQIDRSVVATPWLPIALIVLAAYLFSLLTTILPAWQASRIYPAEALRYE